MPASTLKNQGKKGASGQKAILAMHKKYPAGHQTPRQLAAERKNLALARNARHNQARAVVQAAPSLSATSEIAALEASWVTSQATKVTVSKLRSERAPKFRLKVRNVGAKRYNAFANYGARPSSNPALAGKKAAKNARNLKGNGRIKTTKTYQQLTKGLAIKVSYNPRKKRTKHSWKVNTAKVSSWNKQNH